ncbi:GTP cyclohydrolase 1 [Rostrohypoxylon terebratum]|nr:GTP cyclohydrolase 1 [Rostrohypoxylon terebratum]
MDEYLSRLAILDRERALLKREIEQKHPQINPGLLTPGALLDQFELEHTVDIQEFIYPNVDLASAARQFLCQINEDPDREGLVETPERFAKVFQSLTKGYSERVEDVTSGSTFNFGDRSFICVRDIGVQSLCEHHKLPFFGKVGCTLPFRVIHISYQSSICVQYYVYGANTIENPQVHIGYIPQGTVFDQSTLTRIVEVYARRLQSQERLTRQIAEAIDGALRPVGLAVFMECTHVSMIVEKMNAQVSTQCKLGSWKDDTQMQ